MKRPAVFLDRDGTLVEEVGYLRRIDQIRIIPEAIEAVRRIHALGSRAVVVTNQSGVARGLFDEAFVRTAHRRLAEIFAGGGAAIDAFYFCPHHPTEGRPPYRRTCACRKPAPGMLLRASAELDIDLSRSFVIGDTETDLELAARAGATGILVRTGYGRLLDPTGWKPACIAAHVLEAVQWIEQHQAP